MNNLAAPEIITSFIAGKAVHAEGQERLAIVNPANEEIVSHLYEADAAEVNRAVLAARDSFDSGVWSKKSTDRRQLVMLRIRDLILENADELATLECMNTGIPYSQLRNLHIPGAAHYFQYYAELASQLKGELHQRRGYEIKVSREPVGVAALISPWNGPINLSSVKLAAALAFGNSCVVKPSENTPLAFPRLLELFAEAGLPDGVVNLVNGRGGTTGAALVAHDDVDLVSFTGGGESGRVVNQIAAGHFKRTQMELGGKSANMILESADIDRALDAAMIAIYSANGQQCLAGSRILIQRSIANEFIKEFVQRSKALQIGEPFEERTELGPLANQAHMNKVLNYAEVAANEGAKVLTGGRRFTDMERGWYVEPTVVEASSNDLRVCQEEIFGPFATFVKFDSLDDAIDIANQSRYGLVSYIWSNDLASVNKASREIQAGTIWVNTTLVGDPRAPFGGVKDSGHGREGGTGSVEFYTELKSVVVSEGGFPLPRLGIHQ